jgi:hypothetical protein
MEDHLDFVLEVGLEEEYASLYAWYIQELDGAGNPVGEKLIPWRGYHQFSLKGVRYSTCVQRRFRDELDDEAFADLDLLDGKALVRRISGWLKPQGEVVYSMLGTERELSKINFTVTPTSCSESGEEGIKIMGGVSYTAEIDFRDDTTPDWLSVDITIDDQSFNHFVEQVLRGNVQGQLSIDSPEGFYSEWSPSISTNRLKILNQMPSSKWVKPDQRLVHKSVPDASSVTPPRLGFVRQFSLTLTSMFRVGKSSLREADDQ